MKRLLCGLTAGFVIFTANISAETVASEFSLFKRITSPAMNWGENGLMLVPKAQPIGKGDVNFGVTTLNSGQIQGEKLYLTTGTLMIGTSEDVEVGISKRTFIWENGDRTDIEMDSFHLKARVLQLTDFYTPQVAIGVNGVSIKANSFDDESDILYNPYVVVTLPVRMFTDNFIISFTGVAEKLYSDGEGGETILSAGADMILYDTVYLMAEAQGIEQETEEPIINLGAKLKYGWFSIGAGLFNIQQQKVKDGNIGAEENKEQYWMANLSVEIPLLKLFGGGAKKAPTPKEEFNSVSDNGNVYTKPTKEQE